MFYYGVQLGSTYLTASGAAPSGTNKGCKLTIEGISQLESDYIKVKREGMKQTDVVWELTYVGKYRRELTINIERLPYSVCEDINEIRQDFEDGSISDATLVLTHPYDSNFTYSLKVGIDDFIYNTFERTQFRNAVLRVTTLGT